MSTVQNKNAGSNSEFAVFIELIKDLKNTILMLQEMIKNQNAKLCEYEERDKKKLAASSSTLEKSTYLHFQPTILLLWSQVKSLGRKKSVPLSSNPPHLD